MTSDFEQYTLLKQGISCLIGNSDSGLQWNVIAQDYLQLQTIKKQLQFCHKDSDIAENNIEIVCLLCDRSEQDLKRSVLNVFENDHNYKSLNFKILKGYECNTIKDIYELIESNTTVTNTDSSSNLSITKKKYLFIYSLSELFYLYSNSNYYEIKTLLQQIEQKLNFQYIIMNLHQSLHIQNSTTSLYPISSTLSSLCNVTCYISTNDGTMSDEVCLQIHSFRKSIQTGKVSESVELFGRHVETYIYPLKQNSIQLIDNNTSSINNTLLNLNISNNNNHTDNGSTATSSTSSSSEMLLSQALNSQSTTTITTITNNNITNNPSLNVVNSRLITFDSTDPEFDEDSDPDNDLDL